MKQPVNILSILKAKFYFHRQIKQPDCTRGLYDRYVNSDPVLCCHELVFFVFVQPDTPSRTEHLVWTRGR